MGSLAAIIGAVVSAILTILKGLFGMDTPATTEVSDAPPVLPPPDADRVLADLGLHTRADSGNPVCNCDTGAADTPPGKPDSGNR